MPPRPVGPSPRMHLQELPVFRIRIGLNTDPDPAFKVNTDPDPDPA